MNVSGSGGYIIQYGYVPLECLYEGAECNIKICGRNTLDIYASGPLVDHVTPWLFSITGDIGPLVDHLEHPTSGKRNTIGGGFPTKLGGDWDVFQSYQLVHSVDGSARRKAQEWMDNDPFSSSDDIIMVSRIVIRYILWTHQ